MKKMLMLFLVIFAISLVSATNIGVSPARIDFRGVLRGGYAERPIIVTVDSTNEIESVVSKRGEISDWIDFENQNFSVSRGSPHQLMISVSPPQDTPNGNYTGFVTIKMSQLGTPAEGQATGIVIPSLDVYIVVEVTDEEVISCKATNFEVSSVEEGDDIIFTIDILNEGNVRFKPRVTLDFWDQEATNIVKKENFANQEIIPTKKERVVIKIPSRDLILGQYWVDISAIDCYSSKTLTFDVLEVGALRAYGILERVFALPWADIDDIVEIKATFKNDGEKALQARFKGQVMYNNKVIQLLESDQPSFFQIGDRSDFTFYFTPRNPGKYVISGRVFYDNKRTYEQATIVNVRARTITLKSVLGVVSYIILIILIILLIFKIRQERKNITLKSRGLR